MSEQTSTFPEAIGPYLPLRLLGQGGMAAVYLAVDPRGVEVAVKWLDKGSGRVAHRFAGEIRALKRLTHPNIVRYIDDGHHEGRPYMVIEYIEGQDLFVYADKLRLRPAHERYRETQRIGVALCEALAVVHDADIVHRDVKPSNVLLEGNGRVVLSDFGVIRDPEELERTRAGTLIGTTNYCAPEQLRGEPVDGSADLYGLGCTLFALLTGQPPYPKRERDKVVYAHLHEPIPQPSAIDPSVPPALELAILKLMAKKSKDRPANAREAGRALQATGGAKAPPPLAGRQRYVDAVREALEQVQHGRSVAIQSVGVSGSGRSWLLEVAEELAGTLGVPLLVARDKPTLTAGLRRMRAGEVMAIATRFRLPDDVESVRIILEPVGPADLRRSVVSIAPDTPEPHLVAERLFSATGGHPAWLLATLAEHRQGKVLELPEPLEPPGRLIEAVEELPLEVLEVLCAVCILRDPPDRELVEEVAQVPPRDALLLLEEDGLLRTHASKSAPVGQLVRRAALQALPDPNAMHRRAALALEDRGMHFEAHHHRVACGDARTEDAPARPEHGRKEPGQRLNRAMDLHLSGVLAGARRAFEALIKDSRAERNPTLEMDLQAAMGLMLLEQGQHRLAEARLADAVALARAQERPHDRRVAHLWRAVATLDKRPDSRAAASSALDRVGRALNRVEAPIGPVESALAAAIHARCAARIGDRRGYEKALQRSHAVLDLAPTVLRLRIQLQLAQAALEAGERTEAQTRANAVVIEAGNNGWRTLAWLGRRALARALGTHPPEPRSLAEGLSPSDVRALVNKP